MKGRLTRVAVKIKKVATLCKTMRCMIDRQALVSKNMPDTLKLVFDGSVTVINLIKIFKFKTIHSIMQ